MKKPHSLLIGGTRGIGRALAKVLSDEGYAVSVIGRHAPTEPDQHLPNVRHWIVDLLDRKRLDAALVETLGENGKMNNLIFLQRYRGEGDAWVGEFETSVTATKEIIEHLVDEFDDSKDRSIVLVSSIIAGFVVHNQPLSYHVAKAAFNQMIRYYAVFLGAKGIRVNGVSPATILKDESKDVYVNDEELYDLYKKIIPLRRVGTAAEVAQVISFLCSSKASFVTGQNIVVDGGLTLQFQESLVRSLFGP